jgi:hypothetical protein
MAEARPAEGVPMIPAAATDLPGWRVVAPGSIAWTGMALVMVRTRPAGQAGPTKDSDGRHEPAAR